MPTLVIHRTGDRDVHVEEGRWLAERVPGSRFVELPGEDHFPWVGDQDAILDEVQEFLTGVRPVPEADRLLTTLLFKDLVAGSDIRFTERGAHQLKGIPGEWHLFAAV
jgi:hypothetical protein